MTKGGFVQQTLASALFSTPLLKVLGYIMGHPGEESTDTEIASRAEGVKKSAVNIALRKLGDLGIVSRARRGRMVFNRLISSPLIKHLTIAHNLAQVDPLVLAIGPFCSRVVLFGSRAEGTSTSESDYDLFVITTEEGKVQRLVRRSGIAEKVQLIVKSPEDMLTFEKDKPVFAEQVRKGIALWQTT